MYNFSNGKNKTKSLFDSIVDRPGVIERWNNIDKCIEYSFPEDRKKKSK